MQNMAELFDTNVLLNYIMNREDKSCSILLQKLR